MTPLSRLCAVPASGRCGGGDDDDEASLSSLIRDFLRVERSGTTDDGDQEDGDVDAASRDGDRPDASTMADKDRKAAERITALLGHGTAGDPFRLRLADDIAKAAEEVAALRTNRPAFRRALASRLREAGYDAAVCQTRWRWTSEVTAGSYEYIDVVTAVTGKSTAPGERYIVDVGFVKEFVVARPTADYTLVLEALPWLMVARPKVVQQVVKVAAKAARRSLKSQGLTVPPWREKRFMVAKWFSPHRRTADKATGPRASVIAAGDATCWCRTVGFVLGPPVQPWLSYASSVRHAYNQSSMHVHRL